MNGKKVSLIKVFELSLRHIKEEAMKWLRKNFDNPGRKIQWIITVPAIWSPAAKQTMRRAATGVRQHSTLSTRIYTYCFMYIDCAIRMCLHTCLLYHFIKIFVGQ